MFAIASLIADADPTIRQRGPAAAASAAAQLPPAHPLELHPTGAGRACLWASVFLLLALAALAVDLHVSQAVTANGQTRLRVPGDLRKAVNLAEVFGHGAGAAAILLAVWVVDRAGRRRLPRMVVCVVAAGLATTVLKGCVGRERPFSFLSSGDAAVSVFGTFSGWLPLGGLGHAGESFPSGHTATAVALAAALTWRWPHGWWLFTVFAAMAACQRILSGSHYLSDTLAGAAVGLLAAAALLHAQWAGDWFRRWETPAEH